jgi:hypothetical protein
MRPKLSTKRAKILAELEAIVGSSCYNGNIQNYGGGGTYEGEGRHFRYPLTMKGEAGEKYTRKYAGDPEPQPEILATGYYAFGANRLQIIEALDKVLRHLEAKHGLTL